MLDGWKATRQLRDDPQTADIPIIAVAAEDHTAARLEEVGFCAYLRKPVEPQDLVRAVEFCLERVGEGAPGIELPSSRSPRPGGSCASARFSERC
jgi:CheY-like chemotaxis protein